MQHHPRRWMWILTRKRVTKEETPHRAVIVLAGTHSREGIGQLTAISIVDRQAIGNLESLFPNYRKLPSSDIAEAIAKPLWLLIANPERTRRGPRHAGSVSTCSDNYLARMS